MTPEQTVDEFIARVVKLDLDAACQLVTDDVEYDNVPLGKNHGPQGIKDFLGAIVGTVAEVQFVVHRQACSGEVVLNERTDRFLIDGTWFDLPVAGVFQVRDGKISLWRDYFDMAPVNELLGALAG